MFPAAASRLPVTSRRLGRVALACSVVAGLSAGLSACGGGSRNSYFSPSRVVSFGDENSAIDAFSSGSLLDSSGAGNVASVKGLTYTVHTVITDSTPVVCQQKTPAGLCDAGGGTFGTLASAAHYSFSDTSSTFLELDAGSPVMQRTTTTLYRCDYATIWVQTIARAYGRGFNTQCPLETNSGAVSHATYGATSDDVIAQINAHRGELGSGVLVTIMAGQHDILQQYAAIRGSSTSETAAIGELQARADRMTAAVRDVIGTGAKVVLALTPSLNNSPMGVSAGEDTALLSRLMVAYNDRLYVRGLGNVSGRDLVGVNPDTFTNTSTRSTAYVHSTALCNTTGLSKPDGTLTTGAASDVRFCTTDTLVSGGSTSTYMWADNTHFAPLGHSLIGTLGFNRARQQF
ncbi:MAG: hypothetical protein IIA02_02875 [Proteobacteria bacterium]|uniref:hypothetical protein n=1 Tax=Aquabacterium sp. TaxID=1872578 RepID=UPI0035C6F3FC|nr:hypothetical protein [Pseudomonadota bacterium]